MTHRAAESLCCGRSLCMFLFTLCRPKKWPTCMMTLRTRAGVKVRVWVRECMGNSKRVLRRSVSLLLGKTDRLHALIFATQRVGVFISESDGCIAVW